MGPLASWIAIVVSLLPGEYGDGVRDQVAGITADSAVSSDAVPAGFGSHRTELADGSVIHYVIGGSGPAVTLLHGFPEDWSAWQQVMPLLVAEHTVVAVDLPGIGGSTAGPDVSVAAQAGRISELLAAVGEGSAYVVGHDLGGPIAYALARLHPEQTTGVMLVEAPLEGMPSWAALQRELDLWHIAFHQAPELPEMMIAGHEEQYFRAFLDAPGGPSADLAAADVARYSSAYDEPDELASMLGMYRAMPVAAEFNTTHTGPLSVPVSVVGGADAFGAIVDAMAEDLRTWGVTTTSAHVIDGAGHYVADDQPEALARLISAMS